MHTDNTTSATTSSSKKTLNKSDSQVHSTTPGEIHIIKRNGKSRVVPFD